MARIYLDTCVWCRPFDEPTQERIVKEGEAFFKILRGVDEKRYEILGSVILEDEIEEIKETWKREEVTKLMTKASSE
ncbi:MAG: PIN domain-containing protein, partial [Candidatus Hydrothermarchaeaceae archaeon]